MKTILDSVADDADWINFGPATVPYAGTRKGRQQIMQFFEAIGTSTSDAKVTAENYFSTGDMVITTGRYVAGVNATGAQIDAPIAHFFTIRGGKVVKWVGYSDSAHVAEAHTRAAAATS